MAPAPQLTDDELDIVLAEVFGSCWDNADRSTRDHHRHAARRGLTALTTGDDAGSGADPIRVSDGQVDVLLAELFGAEWRRAGEDVRTDRRWELRYGLALVDDRRTPRPCAA
jgi:hypothetical protein